NLTIEDCAVNVKMFGYPSCKFRKASEDVSISGDELALAVLDMCEAAKTINLQLEDKLVGVEWLRTPGKPHRAHLAEQHRWIIARMAVARCMACQSTITRLYGN